MDIISSFLFNDNKYHFSTMIGDASINKKFFTITENDNILLSSINTKINLFDEYFDEKYVNISQYYYYRHTLQILGELVGSIPNLIAYDDKHGVILMEKIGDVRLNEFLINNFSDKYIYLAIDWLIKLQKITLPKTDIINQRNYGTISMKNEIALFIKYALPLIDYIDYQLFMKNLDNILKLINNSGKTINHRDYQPRNMMIHNDKFYVIDTQDACIGPYFADFTSFIINLNVDINTWKIYAKYFYDRLDTIHKKDSFDEFYQKVLLYGYIRIMKSIGTHAKYYYIDGRIASLEQIKINKTIMGKIEKQYDNPLTKIIHKYFNLII